MRILHIGKYYPPFNGGIEKVNFDLVEALNQQEEYEVDELCFAHSVDFKDEMAVDYKLCRVPIRGIKLSTPIPKGFLRTYLKMRNDYDLIHLHLPNPIVCLVMMLFPPKGKLILHWHCDIVKQKKLKILFNPIQKWVLERSSRIVPTSLPYAESSKDLNGYEKKTVIIPIGIDSSYLTYSERRIYEIKDMYKEKKIIFSLGRLTDYKGYKYLVEAAKYLDDNCVVVIAGKGELDKELRLKVLECGLDGKVVFMGRVSEEDLGSYYKAADVYCMSSYNRTEAFGVVLLEAMSLGLPIVATNIPGSGVTWVNEDGVTGYNVETQNPEALADAIKKIVNDTVLRKQFSINAKLRFEQNFTKEKMVESFQRLYSEVFHS